MLMTDNKNRIEFNNWFHCNKWWSTGIVSGKTTDYPYSWSVPPYLPSTQEYKMKNVSILYIILSYLSVTIALPKVIIFKTFSCWWWLSFTSFVMVGLSWPRRQATNECCLSSQCVHSTRTDPPRYPVYPACCAVYWKTVQWESTIFSGIGLPQTTHSI